MTTLGQARQDDNAPGAQASTYTFTNEDLAKAAAYSNAADTVYGPMSVTLNAVRFAVLHILLHVACMLYAAYTLYCTHQSRVSYVNAGYFCKCLGHGTAPALELPDSEV